METLSFELPELKESEAWGPPSQIPDNFREVPFAPFSKRDPINVVADWYNTNYSRNTKNPRWGDDQAVLGQMAGEEDVDTGFTLATRNNFGERKGGWRNRKAHEERVKREARRVNEKRQKKMRSAPPQTARQKKNKRNRKLRRRIPENPCPPKWSVDVQAHWVEKQDFYINNFYEFKCSLVEEPETLVTYGQVRPVRAKAFDKVKPQTPLKLLPKKYKGFKHFETKTTVDDPVMRELFLAGEGNVYVTDVVLSALMNTFRSKYSFDVIASKRNGIITFDLRPARGCPDLQTLHTDETSAKRPNNKLNSTALNNFATLAREATKIQATFREQALEPAGAFTFERQNPFLDQVGEADVGSQAYSYRRFVLPDDIRIICRGTIMATYPTGSGSPDLANVYALNQYDWRKSSTRNWKKELPAAVTEIMFDEFRNNAFRCGRWAIESYLAGVDRVQIGFITRSELTKNSSHTIVYGRTLKTNIFLKKAAINLDNCWGVLKLYIDTLRKMDDGRYVFLRQPLKKLINLYSVADDEYHVGWLDEQR